MRIITGEARGRRLKVPKGSRLRPTSNMVREAAFNIYGQGIRGSYFLDLFAGTGAIGIEAASRGAAGIDFVEAERVHQVLLRENLSRCGFMARSRIYGGHAERVLQKLSAEGKSYNYIYADPPYDYPDYAGLLEEIAGLGLLLPEGTLLLESGSERDTPEAAGAIFRKKRYIYGRRSLNLYQYGIGCEDGHPTESLRSDKERQA